MKDKIVSDKLISLQLPGLKADDATEEFAREVVLERGVKKMVLLPDSFTKEKYLHRGYKITIPSSSAISTQGDILYPQFRSRGINCGMMVIALPVKKDELSMDMITSLLNNITYSLGYYIGYRLRFPILNRKEDLSLREFDKVLERGPQALSKTRDVTRKDIEALEFKGGREVNLKEVRHLLNPGWFNYQAVRLRHSFGTYFGGNHFFEIQEVTSLGTDRLGLSVGQVVIMFHGGCDSVETLIRKDLVEKYIKKSSFTSVSKREEMWQAFFTAQDIIINYTSAYRLNTFLLVDKAIQSFLGDRTSAYIVLERGHNTVRQEDSLSGSPLVYRHNAERVTSGSHTILSGSHTHESYIMEGGDGSADYLHTLDHGLGAILGRNEAGQDKVADSVELHEFKRGIRQFHSKSVAQLVKNEIVDTYFDLIGRERLAKPVATLRPLVNVKFTK